MRGLGRFTGTACLGATLLPTIASVDHDHVSLVTSRWALRHDQPAGGRGCYPRFSDASATEPTDGRSRTGPRPPAVPLLPCRRALPSCWSAEPSKASSSLWFPLATTIARDNLPPRRSRRTIVMVGITTAVGVGLGYPVAGALTQFLGFGADFGAGAGLSLIGLAAVIALRPNPQRHGQADLPAVALLAGGVAALLLAAAPTAVCSVMRPARAWWGSCGCR